MTLDARSLRTESKKRDLISAATCRGGDLQSLTQFLLPAGPCRGNTCQFIAAPVYETWPLDWMLPLHLPFKKGSIYISVETRS